MLAQNNATGAVIATATEGEVVKYTTDGAATFLGFAGTGTAAGIFTVYIKKPTDPVELPYYKYRTSDTNPTAYIVDRIERFPKDTVIRVTATHESGTDETFYGTILGGSN